VRPALTPHAKKHMKRLIALVILIAALAVGAVLLPLYRIPDAVSHMGPWAPVAGVAIGAVLLCALVPRTAVSLASGLLFGPISGGLVALAAGMIAAAATFAISRVLGRDAVAALEGERMARLDAWLARRGMLGVAVVRMMPLAPFGLVGYAYGTTSVRWFNYIGGTFIGATPSAFTYAAVGAAVVEPGATHWLTFLPAGLGLVVAACAFVYWRRTGRKIGVTEAATDSECAPSSEPSPDQSRDPG
jgi:uncharacterized membrane protein YdjX (TVP38/TMEM64 family)